MTYSFQPTDFESCSGMLVRCCHEALDAGPMGDKERGEFYREFISCGVSPACLGFKGEPCDIGAVKTSCAVFAGSVLRWVVGVKNRPGKVGWPMEGGWLGELTRHHPTFVKWTGDEIPSPGSIWIVQSLTNPNNCHVGAFIENQGGGVWTTAEGGGGDGTRCHIGATRTLGPLFDAWRHLVGWWDAEKLGEHYGVGNRS